MSLPQPPRPRPVLARATPWACVTIVCILGFGAYLRFFASGPIGPDAWWHGVAEATRGSASYAVAVFMAEVGGGIGAATCAAIAAALLLALRRPRDAAAVVTAMAMGVALSELIKAFVLRPRPWGQLFDSHGSSYPSGHSMGAAAFAVSLALVFTMSHRVTRAVARLTWAAAVCWILLMMWSRTALHVHWLSDTIAGALLGLSTALIARRIWVRPDPSPHRRMR